MTVSKGPALQPYLFIACVTSMWALRDLDFGGLLDVATVWASSEEETQGIINTFQPGYGRASSVACRLHPSECTKLLISSTAFGCRFPWSRCQRAGGDALCTVHLGMMFRYFHTTFIFHRMGARVRVCLLLCYLGSVHQVFPGIIHMKCQSSVHYGTVSPNLPPLLYQVQGHHHMLR